jgi:mono/diheme cytochrome c family protein
MRYAIVTATLLALSLPLFGCGQKSTPSESSTPAVTATPGGTAAAFTVPTDLDQGPRAASTPADESMAKAGERLFQTRGCSACHGFGKRISCPDLDGVTTRRTAKWIHTQILHPDAMTKQDPIARQLFAQFMLQMPNQGLSSTQADSVLEFLKHKNHETSEKHP